MYLILNYALSPAFQSLQFNRLQFPGYMYIDYVRVWQEKGKVDVTCDPASHPTANYINEYMEYYTNRKSRVKPTGRMPVSFRLTILLTWGSLAKRFIQPTLRSGLTNFGPRTRLLTAAE